MGYFDFLPKVGYKLEDGNSTAVKNILTRVRILDSAKETQSTFLDYTIRDGERPETIANRVYGRSDYHWIILMFNEIHDPYFSWPLNDNQLDDQVEKLYGQGRKALFVDVPAILLDREKNDISFDYRNPYFEVGGTISQRDETTGLIRATATIESWDPTLMKLVVMPVTGTLRVQWSDERNQYSRADQVKRDIEFTTPTGIKGKAILARITDENKMAVHHFVNSDGEIISPWTNICDHLKTAVGTNCDCVTNSEGLGCSVIEAYALGNAELIPNVQKPETGEFMSVSIVTNFQHELNVNEAKRKIKVMRPELIDVVLKEFRRIVNNTVT